MGCAQGKLVVLPIQSVLAGEGRPAIDADKQLVQRIGRKGVGLDRDLFADSRSRGLDRHFIAGRTDRAYREGQRLSGCGEMQPCVRVNS